MIWIVSRDEWNNLSVNLTGVTNRCPRTKLHWWYGIVYQPYQTVFRRDTRPKRPGAMYPRVIDCVTLVNQTRGELLQPKDWGHRRCERWTKTETIVGCSSANDPLRWPDIKGIREWYLTFTAMVETAAQEDQFAPVVDWLTETTSVVQPLFTGPGELP